MGDGEAPGECERRRSLWPCFHNTDCHRAEYQHVGQRGSQCNHYSDPCRRSLPAVRRRCSIDANMTNEHQHGCHGLKCKVVWESVCLDHPVRALAKPGSVCAKVEHPRAVPKEPQRTPEDVRGPEDCNDMGHRGSLPRRPVSGCLRRVWHTAPAVPGSQTFAPVGQHGKADMPSSACAIDQRWAAHQWPRVCSLPARRAEDPSLRAVCPLRNSYSLRA